MNFQAVLNYFESRRALFFIFLFAVSFIFRAPTLFNDYYDVDELAAILQTHEYLDGGIPGVDFGESKLPLYHTMFKLAYRISAGYGWNIVHFFTILTVFFTAIFIFFAAKRLRGFNAGAVASILYAVTISSFNRHFMATNGEIVFNLPLAAGFCFFLFYLLDRGAVRYSYLTLAIFSAACASFVKQQGAIFFVFLFFYFLFYLPYYWKKFNFRLILVYAGAVVFSLLAFLIDLKYTEIIAPSILNIFVSLFSYSTILGFNPFMFLLKYSHRQGMLMLWHAAVWIPAIIFIFRFIKAGFRFNMEGESALAVMLLLAYSINFLGGERLYFHYFMASYPFACIASSVALSELSGPGIDFVKKRLAILMLLPGLFFLTWNSKDVIIKHFFPEAFYKEGRILYWARAVVVGSFNDYLLPDASYVDAAEYIKKRLRPKDRIYVWGDGPYLYYFSERGMGNSFVWPKMGIIDITRLYEKGDPESVKAAESMEEGIIGIMKKRNAILFADTSANGLSKFTYQVTPLVKKFIDENYVFDKEVNRIKIYLKKGYIPADK